MGRDRQVERPRRDLLAALNTTGGGRSPVVPRCLAVLEERPEDAWPHFQRAWELTTRAPPEAEAGEVTARLTPNKRSESPGQGRLIRSSSWDTLGRDRLPTTSTPKRTVQEPSLRTPLVPVASGPRREAVSEGLRRGLTAEFDRISQLNATT